MFRFWGNIGVARFLIFPPTGLLSRTVPPFVAGFLFLGLRFSVNDKVTPRESAALNLGFCRDLLILHRVKIGRRENPPRRGAAGAALVKTRRQA